MVWVGHYIMVHILTRKGVVQLEHQILHVDINTKLIYRNYLFIHWAFLDILDYQETL